MRCYACRGGCRCKVQFAHLRAYALQQHLRLLWRNVFVHALAQSVLVQHVVLRGFDTMSLQAVAHAGQRTSIDGDDRTARTCQPHQRRDIAPYACDARHLGLTLAVQTHGDVIGQLSDVGATRTGAESIIKCNIPDLPCT